MTTIEPGSELAASKATLNELLQRIDLHVKARDAKINDLTELISEVKNTKNITMDHFIQLRESIHLLASEYTQINELCFYIKGFTACYDQVEPMIQDVETISVMIEKQEEQLRTLSASILAIE
ncbi:hypothetical protein [Enterococcus raffinosus]|uniref:hypothetical protein n=1 Tax=Enterococcus raffinosus TaxID=71452 RepID=UPI001C93FE7C|nr:hypothetical protein [Enterococcus raffinosus]QZO10881.1 hypothetical protein K5P74_14585 [Enterococcus raffinosus]